MAGSHEPRRLDPRTSGLSDLPLHALVWLLCIVSGSVDAICFLALGDVFASVMTGNIVFIGVSIGMFEPHLALSCGIAICGYIAGVLVGSWLANRWRRTGEAGVWPSRVTKTLCVQLAILVALSAAWFVLGGVLGVVVTLAFLAAAAVAMGIQGAAARASGIAISTTYMTGALTRLLESVMLRRTFASKETSAVGGLLALLAGAVMGSLVLALARPAAMLVPTLALAVVIGASLYRERRRPQVGRRDQVAGG